MADINKNIDINVTTNVNTDGVSKLNDGLDKVIDNQTKITQSTNLHTKATNENRKSVLENGGAMGLLGAATGGMAMDFKDAIEAIGLSTDSLKTFKGALAATGIGIAALVILELIQNWDKWVGVIDGSTSAMEKLNSQYEEFMFYKDRDSLANDRLLSLSQARGDSEENQYKVAIGNSVALVKSLEEQIQLAAKLSAEEYKRSGNSEEFKKLRQDEINLEKEKFKAETAALVLYENEKTRLRNKGIEAEKVATKIRLDEAKKLAEGLKRLNEESLKLNTDTLTAISKNYNDILNSFADIDYGETYNKINFLNKVFFETVDSLDKVDEKIGEVTNKLSNKKLSTSQREDLLKTQKELEETKLRLVDLTSELKFKGSDYIKEVENKLLNSLTAKANFEDDISKLLIKRLEIEKTMFDFEKDSGKYGLDNSNKFIEINTKINKSYDNRIEILKKEYNFKKNNLLLEQDNLTAYEQTTNTIIKIIDKKLKNEELSKAETILLQEMVNQAKLRGLSIEEYLMDVEAKRVDIKKQLVEKDNESATLSNEYKLNLATETADSQLAIEQNIWNRKKMMRDEDLERQRMYYNAVGNIANESSSFLDALISNGHIKGKKAAENALALNKVAGVASVVISGQEEIRGIWANKALSALPDAGFSAKSALTAGAVIKHGLSIGTILAQKLNGSASTNSGSNGGGGIASFTTIGASSTNQLAATIGAQQQKPIRAYVLGADIKTNDALDRNIQSNATFL